jgi:hypothetical protein
LFLCPLHTPSMLYPASTLVYQREILYWLSSWDFTIAILQELSAQTEGEGRIVELMETQHIGGVSHGLLLALHVPPEVCRRPVPLLRESRLVLDARHEVAGLHLLGHVLQRLVAGQRLLQQTQHIDHRCDKESASVLVGESPRGSAEGGSTVGLFWLHHVQVALGQEQERVGSGGRERR